MFLVHDDLERDVMPRRRFVDTNGVEWTVYDIVAESSAKRRSGRRPRLKWATAWLVFESEAERRRLSPFPLAWDELSDENIQRLLKLATPLGRVLKRRD